MALKHLYIYLVVIIVVVIIALIYIGTSKIGADTQDMRCNGSLMKQLESELDSPGADFDIQRYEYMKNQLDECKNGR